MRGRRGPATLVAAMATVVALASGLAGQERPAVPARIDAVAWLAGSWAGGGDAARYEEHWTAAAGGAMLATSRTVRGDRMVAFEFLRIVERDGTLVYIAQPQGRPPTEFVLSAVDESSATFSNPAHDFPTVIRYARNGEDGLEAMAGDGGAKAQSFRLARVRPE